MRQEPRIILSAAIMLCATQVHADDQDTRMANLFDKPLATQTVPATSDAEEGNELRCTYYKDFLIREIGTDTPAPAAAVLIPIEKAARPPCKTAKGGDIPLNTENFSLLGRKSDFLMFQATDPNGAVPFLVINATSGKTIFTDGMVEEQMTAITLTNGVLHLTYTRGVNASCSLLSGGKTCWDKMVADRTIPPEVAQAPLPTRVCTEAYRSAKAPSDDPSVVTFDVDMTLDLSGKVNVLSRGKLGCAPMP